MGRWAESEFGVSILPPHAYLFAGSSSRKKIDAILGDFGKVLYHRQDVYDRYLLSGTREDAIVVFQLYGAPIVCDLVSVLKDGNVSEAVFFGYAYGIAGDLRVGDRVLPVLVQTLDGVASKLGAGPYAAPDAGMTEMISESLRRHGIPFRSGKSVSVPATLWHGDETRIDSDAIALELEFAAFCHCAHVTGIKAGGLFVISDTKDEGLLDRKHPRDPRLIEAFRAVRERWRR